MCLQAKQVSNPFPPCYMHHARAAEAPNTLPVLKRTPPLALIPSLSPILLSRKQDSCATWAGISMAVLCLHVVTKGVRTPALRWQLQQQGQTLLWGRQGWDQSCAGDSSRPAAAADWEQAGGCEGVGRWTAGFRESPWQRESLRGRHPDHLPGCRRT